MDSLLDSLVPLYVVSVILALLHAAHALSRWRSAPSVKDPVDPLTRRWVFFSVRNPETSERRVPPTRGTLMLALVFAFIPALNTWLLTCTLALVLWDRVMTGRVRAWLKTPLPEKGRIS